jgi:two-component system, cell cycle response regulator CpdR
MACILIAEDEDVLRGQIVRALTADGYDAAAAADGGEALDMLHRDGDRFDVLLTDIRMPVMDGIALALAAARDHPRLIIVLMTGFAEQRERASGLAGLIHGVITKPFTVAELRHALGEAIGATPSLPS